MDRRRLVNGTLGTGARLPPSPSDRAVKRTRLLGILRDGGARRLVLTSHGAIAWYLDGARTHVGLAGDPVLAVLVDEDADTVVTSSAERARLEAEELPDDVFVHEVAWHEPLQSAWAGATDLLGEADIVSELRAARAAMLPAELERFRALGGDAARVLTDVLGDADPRQTERTLAARVAQGLLDRGIDPIVVLAAGRSRLGYRHPLPTDSPLGDRAMVVVCGRRQGLVANLTRWVRFDAPRGRETDATGRLLEVEAGFFRATRPGANLAEVLAAGSAGYRANGFDAEEWRRHHQGGPAGYNGRDPRALPGLPGIVQAGQAFTWNPSAPGVKVEDTVLATGAGIEVLTVDPRWPVTRVGALDRPAELVL